jgi:excisionase family DNA binding protein
VTTLDNVRPGGERLALSVTEVLALTGIGRDKLYSLIRDGALPARKLGKRTLILQADLDAFLKALPRMGTEEPVAGDPL